MSSGTGQWAGYDPGGVINEPLIDAKTASKFTSAMVKPVLNGTSVTSNLFITTATGTDPVYDKEYAVRKVVKRHKNKDYFYVISVSDTDDVFYQIYKGGKLSALLFKVFGERPSYWKDNVNGSPSTQWNGIRKRTHLPATIGAVYHEIDNSIEKHKEMLVHDDYAKGLLDVEPDNLKMIEGLEKLAEGEPEQPTYSFNSNIAVGAGSFYCSPGASIGYDPDAGPVEDEPLQYDANGMLVEEDNHEYDPDNDEEDCDEFGRYVGH